VSAPFKSQPVIEIKYKGKPLDKKYQPDFICYDEVITEIKAISSLSGTEEAQLINYLKASGKNIGLLLNFGASSLEYKRFVHNLRESAKSVDRFKLKAPVKWLKDFTPVK